MATSNIFSAQVSQEEFNAFHTIDRNLYTILVMELWRDPMEGLEVVALWIWLEQVGYYNTVKKILSLPHLLINEIADEAIICLSCLYPQFASSSDSVDIPLLQSLTQKEISLGYFLENRLAAAQGVSKVYSEVCIRALTDIMQQAMQRNDAQRILDSQTGDGQKLTPSSIPLLAQSMAPNEIVFGDVQRYVQRREVLEEDRTVFVTFSKGYPVQEREVREFLTQNYGDCIESFYMQEVGPTEQSLYARIIFRSASTIDLILDGVARAKFNINGKHVWVRKFVRHHPKPRAPTLQGLPGFPFPFAPLG